MRCWGEGRGLQEEGSRTLGGSREETLFTEVSNKWISLLVSKGHWVQQQGSWGWTWGVLQRDSRSFLRSRKGASLAKVP